MDVHHPVEIDLPGLAESASGAELELVARAALDRYGCCGYFPVLEGVHGSIAIGVDMFWRSVSGLRPVVIHRGPIAGTLDEDGVLACSRELAAVLAERFPEDLLTIPHRVWTVTCAPRIT